jgi:hypothetical protein
MAGSTRLEAEALAKEAAAIPEDPTAPGRFSTVVLLALGVGVVGCLVCVVGIMAGGKDSKLNALFMPGAFILGVAAIAGFFKFIGQAISVAPGDRVTPEKALKAYLYSVRQQRWDAAFACLSHIAKDGRRVVRPAISEVELAEEHIDISSPADLKNYWSGFVGRFKFCGQRTLLYKVRSSEPVSGSVALVPVDGSIVLDVRTASLGKAVKSMALMKTPQARYRCRWPVYETGGLWYLLTAGFPPSFKTD